MAELLIAHRGDTINFEENTIEAFASAFEHGADGVELDVQEQDTRLMVVHDYTYDRTKTYPTLDVVLEQFADKGRLEIEVKSMSPAFVDPLVESLRPYVDADIELTTSVVGIMHYLRSSFPQIPLGYIFQDREFEGWMPQSFIIEKIVSYMHLQDAQTAHIQPHTVTADLAQALHDNGMRLHSHIYATPMDEQIEAYRHLGSIGVDQVTFDDINLVAAISKA